MNKELLLIYNVEENKKAALIKTCADFKIKTKEISKSQTGQKVGFLAGVDGFEENLNPKNTSPDIEFILFVNTDNKKLFAVLNALKEKGFIFPYKAALTEQSAQWDFSYLILHIEEESRIMTEFFKFKPVLENAIEIQKELKNKELGEIIEKAEILMSSGEDMTDVKIREMHEKLKNTLQKIIRRK